MFGGRTIRAELFVGNTRPPPLSLDVATVLRSRLGAAPFSLLEIADLMLAQTVAQVWDIASPSGEK